MAFNTRESDYLNRDLLDEHAPPAYTPSQAPPGSWPPRRAQSTQASPSSPQVPRALFSERLHSQRRAANSTYANQDALPADSVSSRGRDAAAPELAGVSRRGQRLVVSLDFGTTYSGFAFSTADTDHDADLSKIEVLQNWTTRMGNMDKVPSVISYTTPSGGEAQWGTDLSDNAITMVNQKLELEQQSSRIDELDLTLHVLRGAGYLSFEHIRRVGPNPDFSCKLPEEIVRDYLQHISECARKAIQVQQLVTTNTAVDLVVTVPVSWSYQAYNAMFKAVRKAGFNEKSLPTLKDTILVFEPEAAAYFTARDLKERGTEFLSAGQCFVLCDAGGGTVDAVAYQVAKVSPLLELEKVTEPTGRKCGSALIDTAFKVWLRDVIGRDNYAQIDRINARQQRISPHTAEPAAMRGLIKQFRSSKETFTNHNQAPIKLDLPAPLHTLSIAGRVNQGELTLEWTEMKDLMDGCVNDTVELVMEQIKRVKKTQHRRVKNVFLVGGFGASPYLKEELEDSFDVVGKLLRQPDPDKCLTAVVQGGVIYGVEKARHRNVTCMRAATRSYGVQVGRGNFEWLIKKGDLIFSNKTEIIESSSFWWHPMNGEIRNKQDFHVFAYNGDGSEYDDDLPESWEDGQHEVKCAGTVRTALGDRFPEAGRAIVPGDPRFDGSRLLGPIKWRLLLSESAIQAELILKDAAAPTGRSVGRCTLKVGLASETSGRRSPDDADGIDW